MKSIILNNLGLKLLALFLAVVTWFYIVVELQKGTPEEREVLQRILPYRMVSKQIPIKLNLIGEPQKGYMVEYDKIVIEPSTCVMIGPGSFLNRLSAVNTQSIDISEYTKTFTKDISIISPTKGVTMKEKFVSVTIPIIKVKE